MADPNQYQAPINNGVAAQVKSPSSRALEPVKEGWGATKTLPAAFGDPAREVLDRLNELRCYPTLCDVTLIAGGSRLTAHRAILASASHYFLAMFTSGMKEGRAAEVEIGHVQFDVLKTIVDSIYSRTLEITIENVQDLLAAASLLQVSSVVSQCCDFLLNHLDDQNCLGIRAFLTSNGCMETAHRTDLYILNNFPEVSVCEEFVTYPLELLLPILRNDLLNVECEEQVLEAVLRWYNHHEGYCNTGANISSSAMSTGGLRGSFCPMSRLQPAATSVSIAGRVSSLAPKSGSLYKSQEQQHRYPHARSLCHCGRCHGNKHRQCPEIGSLVSPLTQCRPQAVTTTVAAAAQTSPGSPKVVATVCQQPCRCACSPTTQQQQQQQRQSPLQQQQQQQHSCTGPEGDSAPDAPLSTSSSTTSSISSSTAATTTTSSSRSSNIPATDSVQVASAASAVSSITASTSTAAAGVSASAAEQEKPQGDQIAAVAGASSYKPTLLACAAHVEPFSVGVVDGNTAANQTSPSVQARRPMASAGPPRTVSMIGTWSQSYADGETGAEEASQEVSAAAASRETSTSSSAAAAASTVGAAQELAAGDAQWPSSLQAQGTVTSARGVCGGGCWAFPPTSQSAPPPAPAPLSIGSLSSGSSSSSSSLPLSTSHEFLPYSSAAATAASVWDPNPCTVEAQSTNTAAPPAAVGASHHVHRSPPVSHSSTTAASPHTCNTTPSSMLAGARATAEHEERLRRVEHRTRSEHALALLRTLRLVHLSKRSLLEQVGTFPAFRNSMECRNVLDLANRFHLLDEGPARWDMRSRLEMCRPRKSVRGTVFALGGKKSSEHISDSMEIFNSRSGSWTQGPTLLRRRQQLGVVYHNGSIYVIGGSDGVSRLNSVHSWNLRTKDWEVRASLASPRSGVGVGVLEGAIYAAGGYDGHMCLDSVERYDEVNDRWSFVAPMHKRRSFPAVAALTGRLIVVGGNDGTTFLSVAEAYEPHHDRWQSIAHLQKPRAGIGAATLFGCLYVCGGNDGAARLDSVEVYDPDRNEWKLVRPMLAARDGACLCALGSSLVVLGGINGPAYLNTVEEYDPISDTWTFLTSMDVCRVAGGVAVVPTADMVEFSKPTSSKDTSRSPALMGPGEAGRVAQDMALRVLNNAANE